MTALDWVLLLIVAASALLGLLRGLIGVVASLVAWLLAGLAAAQFGGDVGAMLASDGQVGWGEQLAGYALCFAAVWVVVALLGMALRKLAHSAGLSDTDRALGAGLGVMRGVFLACALLLMLGLTEIPRQPVWRDSVGAACLLPGAQWLRSATPEWMARRVDLEGRGTSLQADLRAHAGRIQGVPSSTALPMAIANGLPAGLSASSLPESALPAAALSARALAGDANPDHVGAKLPAVRPHAAPKPAARAVPQYETPLVSPGRSRDATSPR